MNKNKAEDDIMNFHYLILILNFSVKAALCSPIPRRNRTGDRARILKLLRSPGIDSEESIPPKHCTSTSVGDLGSLLLSFPDPGSWISNPGSNNSNKRGGSSFEF
jgi:hypothetical protein